MKALRFALQVRIGLRHALVLAQVLGPRLHQEPFLHALGLARVFGHAPGIGPVTPTLLGHRLKRLQERGAVLDADAVFDLHHDRAAVMLDGRVQQRFGPVVGRVQIRLTLRQAQAMQHQARDQQASRAGQQGGGYADFLRQQTPTQAAGRHRAVEHHQVDGQATATNPVRQNGLRHAVEGGQRHDPAHAQEQQQQHGGPLRRREGQRRHHHGSGHGGGQHQAVGVQTLA
ncbi:hypothetical protein D3C86_1309160 [compost metagenome]